MSHHDKISAFKSGLASASQKISNKRTIAAPATSAPSPAPSQASASTKQELKRKRPEPNAIVYSQPADTGTGNNIMTQVAYAISYLKNKDTPQKLDDLLSYLSILHRDADYLRTITAILKKHDKIDFDPKGFDRKGSYAFRPIHNIRNGDQLLGFLQGQKTAQGLAVRELAEGWPHADDAIRQLENDHKLLVVRNKKDDHARMVWPDDPSLAQNVDQEFQSLWHAIKLPEPDVLISKLEESGLVPANKATVVKPKAKAPEKKTKKARKSGKTTNTHMVGILRDYSHLKK